MVRLKSRSIALMVVILLVVAGIIVQPITVFADTSIHVHVKSGEGEITDSISKITVLYNDSKPSQDLTPRGNHFEGLDNNLVINNTVEAFMVHFNNGDNPIYVSFDKNSAEGTGSGSINYWINISKGIPAYEISLTKTANVTTAEIGSIIKYTFIVKNIGGAQLTNVVLADPMFGENITNTFSDLGVGETDTWEYEYQVPEESVFPLVNTAFVNTGEGVSASDTATVDDASVSLPDYRLTLDKTVFPETAKAGDTVTYTFKVKNTGNTALSEIVVMDPLFDDGDTKWSNTIGTLAPGEENSFTINYTIPEDALFPIINTAQASAKEVKSVTASAIVKEETTSPAPTYGIFLDKSVNMDKAGVGDTVTYTFKVKNTGNTALQEVKVKDPMFDEGESIYVHDIGALASGEVFTFTKDYTIISGTQFPLENIARAETEREDVWDEDSAIINKLSSGDSGSTKHEDPVIIIPDEPVPEGPAPWEQNPEDETVIIEEEEVPLASLPKTGEVSPMLFYGVGAFVTAVGAKLRKK
ncbi:MAG: CARDB domain-containing protein [Eubacteriales bacterium]|nr:CARDB domain-containing protein [Eubacteriales bacterium]MDD4583387.1 CARDB domain-containing protein [Eubacteriales bacterium]